MSPAEPKVSGRKLSEVARELAKRGGGRGFPGSGRSCRTGHEYVVEEVLDQWYGECLLQGSCR